MRDELPERLKNLPPADRLMEAQRAELNRRADALAHNRDGLRTWPEVRAEIEQNLR